jgi:hypothetical protein
MVNSPTLPMASATSLASVKLPSVKRVQATGLKFSSSGVTTPASASTQAQLNQAQPNQAQQWLAELGKNVGGLFFPESSPPAHVHKHGTSPKATETLEQQVAAEPSFPKIAVACFDRLTPEGNKQHTHHYVHKGPVVTGNGEAHQTAFWVGETVTNPQGLDLDAGQKAVQVNLNVLKSYLSKRKNPIDISALPQKARQMVKSFCFDFANNEHTHHALYSGPNVTVTGKDGQPKVQQTAILVGQWLCAKVLREKGLKIDKDVQMGVLVTDNLFDQSKQVVHK